MSKKIRKNKKKIIIISSVILLLVVFAVLVFKSFSYWYGEYRVHSSETYYQIFDVSFDDEEKENVKKWLSRYYKEGDKTACFDINGTVDVYKVLAASKIYDYKEDEKFRTKVEASLSTIAKYELSSMSFQDVIYYLEACDNAGYSLPIEYVKASVERFYHNDDKLYYDDGNTITYLKYLKTAWLCHYLGDKLPHIEEISKNVAAICANYHFETGLDKGFYPSGGAMIFLAVETGNMTEGLLNSVEKYMAAWGDRYEKYAIESPLSAVEYSGYVRVARMLGKTISSVKLDDYYKAFDAEWVDESTDVYMLSTAFEYVENRDNKQLEDNLRDIVLKKLDCDSVDVSVLGLKNTVYGVVLAECSGFEYDKAKVDEYIKKAEIVMKSEKDMYNYAEYMKYFSMYMNYKKNSDFVSDYMDTIQSKLDSFIDSLGNDEDKRKEIMTLDTIAQVFSFYRAKSSDSTKYVKITRCQKDKLEKYISKLSKNDTYNMVYFSKLCRIDRLFELGVISEDAKSEALSAFDDLGEGAGCIDVYDLRCELIRYVKQSEGNQIDEKIKAYLDMIKIEKGIYGMGISEDTVYYDFQSMLIGKGMSDSLR